LDAVTSNVNGPTVANVNVRFRVPAVTTTVWTAVPAALYA
jgi:hypothetical protein